MLSYFTVKRKICGKRHPYIKFEGALYRNDVLSKSSLLVGNTLVLKFNSDDIRTCKAFFEDGSEFCHLCVIGKWRSQPHSLDQRKVVNKLSKRIVNDYLFTEPTENHANFVSSKIEDYNSGMNQILTAEEIEERFKNPCNHIRYL